MYDNGSRERVWYSFAAVKPGTVDEWIDLPFCARTPEGAAACLQALLQHRPDDVTQYRVEVRVALD